MENATLTMLLLTLVKSIYKVSSAVIHFGVDFELPNERTSEKEDQIFVCKGITV